LDIPALGALVTSLIEQQPPMHHVQLQECFSRLLTSSGVDLTRLDKPNRLAFLSNMRAFTTEVRPLLVYR